MIVADVVACAYLDVTVDVSETMHEPAPVRVIRPVVLLTVQMDADEEEHQNDAERTGVLAGVTQAAQQNFLQANAPQASEAPTADAPTPNGQ